VTVTQSDLEHAAQYNLKQGQQIPVFLSWGASRQRIISSHPLGGPRKNSGPCKFAGFCFKPCLVSLKRVFPKEQWSSWCQELSLTACAC